MQLPSNFQSAPTHIHNHRGECGGRSTNPTTPHPQHREGVRQHLPCLTIPWRGEKWERTIPCRGWGCTISIEGAILWFLQGPSYGCLKLYSHHWASCFLCFTRRFLGPLSWHLFLNLVYKSYDCFATIKSARVLDKAVRFMWAGALGETWDCPKAEFTPRLPKSGVFMNLQDSSTRHILQSRSQLAFACLLNCTGWVHQGAPRGAPRGPQGFPGGARASREGRGLPRRP